MPPVPDVAPSCSLSERQLGEQLERYRTVGAGVAVIKADPRRREVRIAEQVPDALVWELVEVERACCPFFEVEWDPAARRLAFSVATADHEPALDAICHALGLTGSAA